MGEGVYVHIPQMHAYARMNTSFVCGVCFSLVQVLLDEIVCSSVHRCVDPVMMEPSVSAHTEGGTHFKY